MKQFRLLKRSLIEELASIPTIDAHEHLPSETERLTMTLDFYSLFEHYCRGDLVSAGMPDSVMNSLKQREGSLAQRWELFKPYFSAIRTTAYTRSALLVIRDILGFPDLNDDTYQPISQKLRDANKPGHYDEILMKKCNIKACIQCWHYGEPGPDYFYHLAPAPLLVNINNKAQLLLAAQPAGIDVANLDDYLQIMEKTVALWKEDPKVVGIKSAHAYSRSIAFQRVEKQTAQRLFTDLMRQEQLRNADYLVLQDYLMYELTGLAVAADLPMVFHTGLQAGNYNNIKNANPLHLQPLLTAFRRARFDIFHGGMPWVREVAVLAKYFPGVHLNMAWMNIISPAQTRSALSEWLDMVPNTKIFGFGGDYNIVEKVYGHLVMARQNIAHVLAAKVVDGQFDLAEARLVARRLIHDNPREFYRLHNL